MKLTKLPSRQYQKPSIPTISTRNLWYGEFCSSRTCGKFRNILSSMILSVPLLSASELFPGYLDFSAAAKHQTDFANLAKSRSPRAFHIQRSQTITSVSNRIVQDALKSRRAWLQHLWGDRRIIPLPSRVRRILAYQRIR